MTDLNISTSLTTLNVNDLMTPVKIQRFLDLVLKKEDQMVLIRNTLETY